MSFTSIARRASIALTRAVLVRSACRPFHSSTPAAGGGSALSQHRDTPYNNESTPFDFTEENYKLAKQIIAKYPPNYRKSALIPLLDLAQRQEGWLPLAAMNKVAKILGIAPMEAYETASFYTMFNRTPVGKYHLQVCTTTPCMIRGSGAIMEACSKRLGVHNGETTPDKKFTLQEVECLGACVNAPMMQVGDEFYEDLTPETVVKVIDEFDAGRQPTPGPQNGLRKKAEGPQGKTTLLEPPSGPYCRDL